jgi:hypothetical protein
MRRSVLWPWLCIVVIAALRPAAAGAAERWAAPAGTRAPGPCLAIEPCRLDLAIGGAVNGDEVILTPGDYAVAGALEPTARITLRGEAGKPRPVLIGAASLQSSVLSFKLGGTLRHLALQATAAGQDALTMQGGLAEDVILVAASGDGAKLVGSPAGTVLRDSVVRTDAAGGGAAALKLRESGAAGNVLLRNVTVWAPGATGIRCEVSGGQVSLVNVLVRGTVTDVDAGSRGARCSAAFSNFRPALSPGLAAGAGNQQAEPLLADAAHGDYRPQPGSPTIDAGGSDPLLGTADPAGCARTLGGAPDIGAYEYASGTCVPATNEPVAPATDATPAPDTTAELPRGVPAPVQGATIVVAPGPGKVLVRRPGSRRFSALAAGTRLPVGSEFDTRDGRLRLVSAVDGGRRLQDGTFWGGRFTVRQSRRGGGMTSLVLRGGSFARCPTASASRVAHASRKRPPLRRLWARDQGGRFRTHGHNSVATARGTAWVTEDSCDGTLTRVQDGAVAVRDRASRKTVIVRAGGSYLARPAR